MSGQGCCHGRVREGIGPPTGEPGPPTGEPGPANQKYFSPQGKRVLLQTEILLSFHHLSGWLVSDNPTGKEAKCEVPGWRGYTWSVVVRLVWGTAKFFKTTLEAAYGIKINIKLSGNSFGGHSCCQHSNCTLPQNLRHLWHCVVWQNGTFQSGLFLSPAQCAPV